MSQRSTDADQSSTYGVCPKHGPIAAEESYAAMPYPNCPLCGRRLDTDAPTDGDTYA